MKPKICLISPRFPPDPGGVSNASARLADYLWSQGQLACVIVVQDPTHDADGSHQGYAFPVYLCCENQSTQILAACWQKHSWNLIHAYYPSLTALFAVRLGEISGCSLILSARGNDIDRDIWKSEIRQKLLIALTKSQAIAGVTTELRQKLQALLPQHRTYYVPNSVDSHVFRPLAQRAHRQKYALPLQAQLMGFVGEARLKKGWPLLLNLFTRLAEVYPELYLVVVGLVRPGEAEGLLTVWKKQHPKLLQRLIEIPYQSSEILGEIYACMDFLVFPSYQEGMANAALEAMACGKAILTTSVGGFSDLIEHGVNGFLTAPYQLEELYYYSQTLLLNADLRLKLGAAARRIVLEKFSHSREWDNWSAVYQNTLNLD